MFLKNTVITYPALLIMSIKKSFEALGQVVKKTGKTISRWLQPAEVYYEQMAKLTQKEFATKKELVLIFDETVIRKIYSELMEGAGYFYVTQLFRRVMGYKLIAAMVSDGKIALPIAATFLFSKELVPYQKEVKYDWIKKIIKKVALLFPKARIIVSADGAFANKDFLKWCVDNAVAIEVRMRSNCCVMYQATKIAIREIQSLIPKGRQMARTIAVTWHEIPLYITAQRRIDKKGNESIVYQASTFEEKPIRHVEIYKIRWNIEKMFRTTKQELGLEECSSRKIHLQESHVASVLLAYAFLVCDKKHYKFPTPEHALRAAKRKNGLFLERYIHRLDRLIH